MGFRIDIPGLGEKAFSNLDDMRRWIRQERDSYSWTQTRARCNLTEEIRKSGLAGNGSWILALKRISTTLDTEDLDPNTEEGKLAAQESFNDHLKDTTPLWTETTDGEYIQTVKEKKGDRAALGALSYFLRVSVNNKAFPADVDFVDGWTLAFLRTHGLQKKVPSRHRTIDQLRSDISQQFSDLQTRIEGEVGEANRAIYGELEDARRLSRVARQMLRRHTSRTRKQVEKLYSDVRDHIAMHESVEYWKKIRKLSEVEMGAWRTRYFMCAGIGAGILFLIPVAVVVGVLAVPEEALSHIGSRLNVLRDYQVGLFGAGAVSVGVWLWITRIFGRLYLESRSQKEDAERRETMISSYLAMLTDPKAFEKDASRELVLPSIFNPSRATSTDTGGPPVWIDRFMRIAGAR